MNDIRDIMDMGGDPQRSGSIRREKKKVEVYKRPEGMHRELFALLCSDGGKTFNHEMAPLLPSDTPGGYKQKINLSAKKVRPWRWTPFENPARKDGAILYHWRRIGEEKKEYPFAKFNKEMPIKQYTDLEYLSHLEAEGWNKKDTDQLFDLCRRFDLRFPVIHDRFSSETPRSIEDLKERYYNVTNVLTKLQSDGTIPEKIINYDAENERKRKEQMNRFWKKTPEQIEEEEFLRVELKKIEARKREREKKTQDLQKLITAADGVLPQEVIASALKKTDHSKKSAKKKSVSHSRKDSTSNPETFSAIKWPDFKSSGAMMRSQRIKLPGSVGQKKLKAIEQVLIQLNVDLNIPPTQEISQDFNDLRSDIVLLYELKLALQTCEVEVQSLASQYEATTGVKLEIPDLSAAMNINLDVVEQKPPAVPPPTPAPNIVQLEPPLNKKRKAALEQGNVLKKLKNKV